MVQSLPVLLQFPHAGRLPSHFCFFTLHALQAIRALFIARSGSGEPASCVIRAVLSSTTDLA